MSTLCGVLLTFLSAGDFDTRQSAQAFWARLGPLGCPVLAVGLASPDAEVRHQCRKLLPSGGRWAAATARHPHVLPGLLFGKGVNFHEPWTADELWVAWETATRLGADLRGCPPDKKVVFYFHEQIAKPMWSKFEAIRERK